ncbi:MAG TPA: hypothetical protein VHJ16_02965, partial [Xanthobacteraceae bacterium]|nr:hypothetical protein [Xanthobacteraceae bacterium]
ARRCVSSVFTLNIGTPSVNDDGGLSIRPPGIAADQAEVVAGAFSLAGTSATYHVTRSPKYGYDRAK